MYQWQLIDPSSSMHHINDNIFNRLVSTWHLSFSSRTIHIHCSSIINHSSLSINLLTSMNHSITWHQSFDINQSNHWHQWQHDPTLWDLVFVHLFFVFSYPYFLISDINVLFHGSIDHSSTITSYVTIVMKFVTFNVMSSHIGISCLNISSISPTICNFMSKFSTIKTMTIK